MALKQMSGRPLDQESVRPRNEQLAWLGLGALVYAWTDRREANVDRSWWKSAGIRPIRLPLTPAPDVAAADLLRGPKASVSFSLREHAFGVSQAA